MNPAERAYRKFVEHAKHCVYCVVAQPNPESALREELCAQGALLRNVWERAEGVKGK